MDSFRWPGVSVINTASILCYLKVSFRSFKMSWNTYFLNFLCQTQLHSQHLVDCSIALFRSFWLFPMSVLSFSTNCWLRWWASQNLVRPLTPRLLINTPKACCMTRAMHGMWFLIADLIISEESRGASGSWVIEWFDEALSVIIHTIQSSVSLKQSKTCFKCFASVPPVCWPLTYYS